MTELETLEARQAKMVAINKALRNGDDMALLAMGYTGPMIAVLKACAGFTAYELHNNSGNIRRAKRKEKT